MLEFLQGIYYNKNGFEGEVTGFNKDTQKLVITGVTDEDEEERTIEVDLYESGINFNINDYEEWQEKIYTGLIRNEGKILVQINSTESGDSWFLEIYRHKSLLPTHEHSDDIIIINYCIVFCGEVKGEILSRQYDKKYPNYYTEDKKIFSRWIEEQLEKVSEFNCTEYWNVPINAIISSESLNTKEDYEFLRMR